MIYLIDNYDSFTYNLYQLMGSISSQQIKVIKNDEYTVQQLEQLDPEGLIFSPGPGRPEAAGNMLEIIKQFLGKIPILGVCLGEQAIAEVYGAQVVHAPKLMHGKPSKITLTNKSQLFENCPNSFEAARYHSLIVDPNTLPENISITAQTDDHEIMAICDDKNKIFGVQFHPESIMTDLTAGTQIAKNYLQMI